MSVHFGGICFFDTDTEFVSFAFRGNRKDSPSSRTLSRICCRSSVSEIKTVSPAHLMLFTLRPFITTPFSSLIFLKNYLYTLKLIKHSCRSPLLIFGQPVVHFPLSWQDFVPSRDFLSLAASFRRHLGWETVASC